MSDLPLILTALDDEPTSPRTAARRLAKEIMDVLILAAVYAGLGGMVLAAHCLTAY